MAEQNDLLAGAYPEPLLAACARCGLDPEELVDWAVRRREVVLILETGQKVRVTVDGEWNRKAKRKK